MILVELLKKVIGRNIVDSIRVIVISVLEILFIDFLVVL